MLQEVWETYIVNFMENAGWKFNRNDETTLGFSFIEGEHHWIKDYDKKTKTFVQFDGNQKVNIRVSK